MMRSLPFHTDTENAGDHSRPPASFLVPGRRTHRRAFRRDAFPSFPPLTAISSGQPFKQSAITCTNIYSTIY